MIDLQFFAVMEVVLTMCMEQNSSSVRTTSRRVTCQLFDGTPASDGKMCALHGFDVTKALFIKVRALLERWRRKDGSLGPQP